MNKQQNRNRTINTENEVVIAGVEDGQSGEGEWEVEAPRYGLNKSWE